MSVTATESETPKEAVKRRTTAKSQPRQPGAPYTKQEAADFLRISTKQVERLISRGLLKKSKAVRTCMISARSVENFADETA